MTCSEKACVLPAAPGAALCTHHARMFAGDIAFTSPGAHGGLDETPTKYDERRKRSRGQAARDAAKQGRVLVPRSRRFDTQRQTP